MPIYRVKACDCIRSIAVAFGHVWTTIWDHPKNEKLREVRKNPTSLQKRDEVFIPGVRQKQVSLETGKTHKITVRNVPLKLELILQEEDGAAKQEVPYEVEFDRSNVISGKTDADGRLEVTIPVRSTKCQLRLYEKVEGKCEARLIEEYKLNLGGLDPANTTEGAQARLGNLGYYCGRVDGELGPLTTELLQIFQADQGLEQTGELDDDTAKALYEAHDSV